MSKTRAELIASVKAMLGKVTNKGKTPQGRFSSDEFNDLAELLVLLEGLSMPTIDVSDIDDLGLATSILSTSPAMYAVTATGQSVTFSVGVMMVFGDNAGHCVTEVLTTHYVLDENGEIDTTQHIDGKVFQYYRSCKISGGTLPVDVGEWTPWSSLSSGEEVQEEIDAINDRIDAIIGGSATLSLSVSPASTFTNTEVQVTVTATASQEATAIDIKKNGNAFQHAENVQSTSKSETLMAVSSGTIATYSAEATILGTAKTVSGKTVKAYDKIYYGVGAENSYEGITTHLPLQTSAVGSYTFNPVSGKQYAYILEPYAMTAINLSNVKLDSGFGYNLTLISDNVTIDNARYRVYRSAANAVGESFTVKIS